MSDASLMRMFEEVRWQTLRILDGVDDREVRWAPQGLQNTILWHAGHAYVVVESCTMRSLEQNPVYPEGWYSMFSGEELRPAEVPPESWPDFANVITELRKQRDRFRELYESLTEMQLGAPATHRPNRTVRYMILHGLYDEAAHGGEMWLLRKMQRAIKPLS